MMKNMLSAGLSMGLVSSLVNLGTLALQTSINRLGRDIIVAHTAARKITEMFMIMFGVFGQTMAIFCGQNAGAGRMDRVRYGIGLAVLYTCIWSVMTVIFSFTIGKQLIYLVTGSHNETVIRNAANYLKFDTIFYFVTAVISVLRNAMQGLGETVIPLVSKCAGDDRKSSDRGDSGATSRIYRRDRSRTDSLGHYGDPADREDT